MSMSPQAELSLLFLSDGLLLAGLSMPLIRGRVRRNAVYGFRTPKTLASDAVWYPTNRCSGRQLFGAGLATALGALALLALAGRLSVGAVRFAGVACRLPSPSTAASAT